MIKNINFYDFCNEFKAMNRDENFTYEGKRALFDYLEQYEESTGEPLELDIIALCCDYTEFSSLAELQEQYPNIKDLEDLNDHTTVIEVDNSMKTKSFIIANF